MSNLDANFVFLLTSGREIAPLTRLILAKGLRRVLSGFAASDALVMPNVLESVKRWYIALLLWTFLRIAYPSTRP